MRVPAPRPYQVYGIHWLCGRKSAILADDTGLGKTLELVHACRALKAKALVVCPKSLIQEWLDELRKWWPEAKIIVPESPNLYRRLLQYAANADIKLVNYERLLADIEALPRRAVLFDTLILDEAQRVKNDKTQTYDAIWTILRHFEHRPSRVYLATATPVENKPKDLVNLLQLIGFGLCDLTFERKPRMDIKHGRLVQYVNPAALKPGPELLARLRRVVLRRRKEDVLPELPPLQSIDRFLELGPSQRELYEQFLKDLVIVLDERTVEVRNVLAKVTYLREVCDAAQLIDRRRESSAKLQELRALTREIVDGGHKVVIFSEFRKMTTIIVRELRRLGMPVAYIHGAPCDVATEKRRFAGDAPVLVCTKAGEQGLNLQCASYVINVEPVFNPARMKQREGRCHRGGQTERVTVYNLLAKDTYEERVCEILGAKRELFAGLVDALAVPKMDYVEWVRKVFLPEAG